MCFRNTPTQRSRRLMFGGKIQWQSARLGSAKTHSSELGLAWSNKQQKTLTFEGNPLRRMGILTLVFQVVVSRPLVFCCVLFRIGATLKSVIILVVTLPYVQNVSNRKRSHLAAVLCVDLSSTLSVLHHRSTAQPEMTSRREVCVAQMPQLSRAETARNCWISLTLNICHTQIPEWTPFRRDMSPFRVNKWLAIRRRLIGRSLESAR